MATVGELRLAPPPRAGSIWQRLYAQAHFLRRRFYRSRQVALPVPVISVGNLHWGGSGKTPATAAIARFLHDHNERVAIVSRGYRRRGRGALVVSLGDGPLCSPDRAGDEPFLLARMLPGVGVVVGVDRIAATRLALEQLDPTIVILDDGFSHLKLARDLDILLFPAADPFGGGRLAPGGRLREPMFSVAHAHAALLTGVSAEPQEGEPGAQLGGSLEDCLKPFGFTGRGFVAIHHHQAVDADGAALAPASRVVLVSGVARPLEVERCASRLGLEVVEHLAFADHYPYPERSLQRIRNRVRSASSATLLTTGKDRVKLEGRLGLPIAELRLESRPESAFLAWLAAELSRLRT